MVAGNWGAFDGDGGMIKEPLRNKENGAQTVDVQGKTGIGAHWNDLGAKGAMHA